MKIVFAALPAYGHVYPLVPLALACADAGHEVVFACGDPFVGRLPLPTVHGLPPGFCLADAEAEVKATHPGLRFPDDLTTFATAFFGEVSARHAAAQLEPALLRIDPDLVVYEGMDVAAPVVAHRLGIPAIAFGLGLYHPILPDLHRKAAETLGAATNLWPADGYLDPMPPALQRGRADAVPGRIPIRPVAWAEQVGDVRKWLGRAAGRPRVYVTLGTVSFGAVGVLRNVVEALAERPVAALVAVGPEGDVGSLGPLPSNVHAERFVPQHRVWPLVDLAIQHGGAGTTLGAAAAGLPQLLLPQGADHFVNAEALTAAGAGCWLLPGEQDAERIGAAVDTLLADGPQRAAAAVVADEIAALPDPARVVATLVRRANSRAMTA